MPIRIVQLGSPRWPDEGLRIGTVRRPPRGVGKDRYAKDDWYDVWYPELAPTPDLMAAGKATRSASDWNAFVGKFRRQMSQPAPRRTLDVLSALSPGANFSLGCYCAREARCHRAVLRALLEERGASMRCEEPASVPRHPPPSSSAQAKADDPVRGGRSMGRAASQAVRGAHDTGRKPVRRPRPI